MSDDEVLFYIARLRERTRYVRTLKLFLHANSIMRTAAYGRNLMMVAKEDTLMKVNTLANLWPHFYFISQASILEDGLRVLSSQVSSCDLM